MYRPRVSASSRRCLLMVTISDVHKPAIPAWLLRSGLFVSFVLVASRLVAQPASPESVRGRQVEFFEEKIRPVLVEHCYQCHSAEAEDVGGQLLLDSRAGVRTGGESGPAVVPRDIEASLLLSAIEYRDFEMPPDGRLPRQVIRDFRRWIAMGAPDPRDAATRPAAEENDWTARKQLWSLRRVVDPPLPAVKQRDWADEPADYFILARQERHGVQPVEDADPLTWLRRVSFDITGLPPSLDDIRTFSRHPTSDDYRELVDRLLASSQYGERWARHWLDVVRFGESAGSSRDVLMIYAWRYRDYVIDALNADVPYNRFVTEQIAGDLLHADSPAERDRQKIATGLLAIGSKSLNGGNLQLDIIDDQIDVVGKAILGLTVSCARCHDHKFDPIETADYYALAGIFQSTETVYGGSVRRPKNAAERLDAYLTLGEGTGQLSSELAALTKRVDQTQKKQQELSKTVNRLRRRLPKEWKSEYTQLLARQREAKSLNRDDPAGRFRLTAKQQQLVNQASRFPSKVAGTRAGKEETRAAPETTASTAGTRILYGSSRSEENQQLRDSDPRRKEPARQSHSPRLPAVRHTRGSPKDSAIQQWSSRTRRMADAAG